MNEYTSLFAKDAERSLILAGGGMRVAYHAGVLIALEESGIKFSHVDGTSGGIFNTAMLTSGVSPKQMAENWRTLKLSNFVSARKTRNYLSIFKMQGYADADNIRDKVFPHLGINLKKINANQDINATFNVCSFKNKSVESISNKQVKQDHLLAGVSLPIFMPALKVDGDWYTDAVWIKDANLVEAAKQGSDEIWLVWAIGNTPTYLPGAFRQYVHMIEMSANGALIEEYSQIKAINENVKLFVIKSPVPLPLDPDFFFNKINARELINMGYSHTKSYLQNPDISGEKLDEKATQCLEPKDLLSFRATYTGKLSIDGITQQVVLYTFTQFASFENSRTLEQYSSLKLANEDFEVSTYNMHCELTNEKTNTLNSTCSIILQGRTLKLKTTQKVSTPLEIMLGLGFKKTQLQLTTLNNEIVAEGLLYQSFWNRVKSAYHLNLTSIGKSGLFQKLKTLQQMTKPSTNYKTETLTA